jgi:predicted nuclease of predicted toxin-antitoxin system
LREAGHDAQAVRELGLREAEDDAIWDYARAQQTVIVTKDQDFADRSLASQTAPIIVWLRVGNTSNRALLAWLLPLWPDIISRIQSGDKLIEVREKP